MGSHRLRGLTLVSVSAICFGSAGVCAKAAMAGAGPELTPLRLVQFRITASAVVLMAIVVAMSARHRHRQRRGPESRGSGRMTWNRPTAVLVLVYGLVGFVAVQSLYFFAIHRMAVGVALLIEYFAPALVAVWVVFVQHRPQPRTTWIGIGLTVCGLFLIARPWDGFALDGLGVAAALTAAVALAAYFLVAEAAGSRLPALELCAWAATVGSFALALVQPWWSFPFSTLDRRTDLHGQHPPVWVLLVVVVLAGTVVAYLTGIGALAYLPAPVVATVATVEVVIASIAAWVLLNERLSVLEIAGGVVLLGGAALAQRRQTGAPATPSAVGIITP